MAQNIPDMNGIRKAMYNAYNLPTIPNSVRPRTGMVIDQEKSVRWNEEEVQRLQTAWEKERAELLRRSNDAMRAAENDLIERIRLDMSHSISEKGAREIFNRAYDDKHDEGVYAVVDKVEDLMDFVDEVMS